MKQKSMMFNNAWFKRGVIAAALCIVFAVIYFLVLPAITMSYDIDGPTELTDTIGDVTVTVKIPEGAFPDGATMEMSLVDVYDDMSSHQEQSALDAAADELGTTGDEDRDVMVLRAIDISFHAKDNPDEELEPLVPISVTMTSAIIGETESVAVVHLPEDGDAEVVAVKNRGDSVSFESDAADPVILETVGEQTKATPEDAEKAEEGNQLEAEAPADGEAIPEDELLNESEANPAEDSEENQSEEQEADANEIADDDEQEGETEFETEPVNTDDVTEPDSEPVSEPESEPDAAGTPADVQETVTESAEPAGEMSFESDSFSIYAIIGVYDSSMTDPEDVLPDLSDIDPFDINFGTEFGQVYVGDDIIISVRVENYPSSVVYNPTNLSNALRSYANNKHTYYFTKTEYSYAGISIGSCDVTFTDSAGNEHTVDASVTMLSETSDYTDYYVTIPAADVVGTFSINLREGDYQQIRTVTRYEKSYSTSNSRYWFFASNNDDFTAWRSANHYSSVTTAARTAYRDYLLASNDATVTVTNTEQTGTARKEITIDVIAKNTDVSAGAGIGSVGVDNRKTATQSGDNYDLALTFAERSELFKEGEPVDVVFVVDMSTSMNTIDASSDGTTRLDEARAAIATFESTLSARTSQARYSMVLFGGQGATGNTTNYDSAYVAQGWSSSIDASLVNTSNQSGLGGTGSSSTVGTNYEAAILTAKTLLRDAKVDSRKVVVFLTDGNPSAYYSTDGGSGIDNAMALSHGITQLQSIGLESNDYFYMVGCGEATSDVLAAMVNACPVPSAYVIVDSNDMSSVMSAFSMQETVVNCSDVLIADKLSQWVEFAPDPEAAVYVYATNGTGVKTLVETAQITVDYEMKTIEALIPGEADPEMTYSLEYKVVPSEEAKIYYIEHGSYPGGADGNGSGFYSDMTGESWVEYTVTGQSERYRKNYQRPTVTVGSSDSMLTVTTRLNGFEQYDEVSFRSQLGFTIYEDTLEVSKSVPYADLTESDGIWTYTAHLPPGTYRVVHNTLTVPENMLDSYSSVITSTGGAVTNTANVTVIDGNTAYVTFSNSPAGAQVTLRFYKYLNDINDSSLAPGVTFSLYDASNVTDGVLAADAVAIGTYMTDEQGKFDLTVSVDEEYYLVETGSVDGYERMPDTIIISNGTARCSNAAFGTLDSGDYYVINSLASVSMPNTGGNGISLYIISGALLVAAAALMLCRARRRYD